MNSHKVSALSNVVIAFSTLNGVGAAIAYYLKEIIKENLAFIILCYNNHLNLNKKKYKLIILYNAMRIKKQIGI